MAKLDEHRPLGLSGIMRVKNDASFIKQCVFSCINALDELIIVYNDCSDESPDVIEELRSEYPDKIKVFEYPYKVFGAHLSQTDYEYARSLPKDSPHLLCNYYNFALSKVTYSHALKIDADQLYFVDKLSHFREIIISCPKQKGSIIGKIFHLLFTAYRYFCLKLRKKLPFLPKTLIQWLTPFYERYALSQFSNGHAAISLSGVNVFKDQKWYVTMGRISKNDINLIPPFNGEGDHLIFPMSSKVIYEPFEMSYYNKLSGSSFSIIEEFHHPYKVFYMGFAWFHLNTMRPNVIDRVRYLRTEDPECFVLLKDFTSLSFGTIERICDSEMFSLFQRLLFSYIYVAYGSDIRPHETLLK